MFQYRFNKSCAKKVLGCIYDKESHPRVQLFAILCQNVILRIGQLATGS